MPIIVTFWGNWEVKIEEAAIEEISDLLPLFDLCFFDKNGAN